MTVDEVRAIREKKSLETVGMSVSELNAYYSKGAGEMQKKIDAVRKQKSTPLTIIRPESKPSEPVHVTLIKPDNPPEPIKYYEESSATPFYTNK